MHRVPGTCIRIAFVGDSAAAHSIEYLMAGKTKEAHDAIIYGARTLAMTAADLIKEPGLIMKIKEEFAVNRSKERGCL